MKKNQFIKFYQKFGVFAILVLIFAFFSIVADSFLSIANFTNILKQTSMLGTAVIGVAIVMISGGADLSIGGQIACSGIICAQLMNIGVPWPIAALICIIACVLFGCLNGYLAVKMNVMPMIVTLGTMLLLQGLAYVICGGYPVFGLPDGILVIGQGYVGPIPVPVIIFTGVFALAYVIVNKTYFGRYMFALGGNQDAARLAGINVGKIRIASYALCSFFGSIAGLIVLARNNSAQPSAAASYPFDCMTAAVLGGISFSGGSGNVTNAVLGVIVIGILNNGLILMGIDSNWQNVVKGLILLLAIGMDAVKRTQKNV